MSESIIARTEGRTGRISLNRPKALHALDLGMVQAITRALQDWQGDAGVKLILIDHAEGRGFCAGGDVVTIAKSAEGHGRAGQTFFFEEYRMNHLMYTYPKRGVVFMDGITMGGGVGISCPCKYRIATERTMFAMPETSIGLFPDVGGGWHLSRLLGRLPQFLALTGARLDGAECFALGLATAATAIDRKTAGALSEEFKTNEQAIKGEFQKMLGLQNTPFHPNDNIIVVGHTDNAGDYDYNLSLSKRRAGAVVDALIEDYGIAEARLRSDGVGYLAPAATNTTDAGRALNRRVTW